MYCQPDDLTTLLPKHLLLALADDSDDASGLWEDGAVQAVLNGECDGASREIDSLIGGRYAVPVYPVPPVVRDWCMRLTVARLFLRRPDMEGEAPGRWRKEAERITRLLEKVAGGQVSLGADELGEQSTPDSGRIGVATRPKIFGSETWGKF